MITQFKVSHKKLPFSLGLWKLAMKPVCVCVHVCGCERGMHM